MKGFYFKRADGDGELAAIIANPEETNPELCEDLLTKVKSAMGTHEKNDWVAIDGAEPGDFPVILAPWPKKKSKKK